MRWEDIAEQRIWSAEEKLKQQEEINQELIGRIAHLERVIHTLMFEASAGNPLHLPYQDMEHGCYEGIDLSSWEVAQITIEYAEKLRETHEHFERTRDNCNG